MADAPATKGAATRARIREAALRSFRERGYDATTVRRIADELGLSIGATNYHFPSKQDLIQELYLEVQHAHRAAAAPLLAAESRLVRRLGIVFRTGIAQLRPYEAHADEFVAAAVSPSSPINPLAPESGAAFAVVEALFAEAVDGATGTALPDDIRAVLPRALVVAHLLLALFWTSDRSPTHARTERLVTLGLGLVRSGLPLLRLAPVRRPLRELLSLVGGLRG